VVVGAGLSGIGAGYRLQTECPDRSFVIVEAREDLGGTWDLFRYPGVRSDSDMFTLGYPFEPWLAERSIADGSSILRYLRETAAKHGIDRRIVLRTRVVAADWSTREALWTLTLEQRSPNGTVTTRTMTCAFLYSCAGYYDYAQGHEPAFAGVSSFAGEVVHPQFWPASLDFAGKRVVVIGSGATAVTLVPAMAATAAHVTMLQRSPTWIAPVPGSDRFADRVRAHLPPRLAHRLVRAKNIAFSTAFYQLCRRLPKLARRLLLALSTKELGDPELVAEHFTPSYDPWDQRLCAVPDADLFEALRTGRAEVVTDHVETFVPEGLRLRSGRVLPADVVVTATGLRLRAFGGISPTVDGRRLELAGQYVWRGAMVTGLPNFAVCIGYTNASWTLRADLTSRLVCRVLQHMTRRRYAAVEPAPAVGVGERPLLELSAGYVRRALPGLPKQGDRGVWRTRQNYLLDTLAVRRTDLDATLVGTPRRAPVRGAAG
jgi:cation diffusion facilitator CzcD-associated flavoprotein CzcO